MQTLRLQKYFSECGVLSRRAAEEEIAAGHVLVNGLPASLGMRIDPELDTVEWNGVRVLLPDGQKGHTYIFLNKPVGYVTTVQDERGRPTVLSLLHGVKHRVYPVGRLDMYSEGLLLLTDDGELTNRLTHPSHSIPKRYVVTVKGTLDEVDAARYTAPMTLEGYRLRPVQSRLIRSGERLPDGVIASQIELTLHEGRNRQIRRMSEQLGYTVIRLQRIALGELTLDGLPCGHWRYLTDSEVAYLQRASHSQQGEESHVHRSSDSE